MLTKSLRQNWLFNVRGDVLAGLNEASTTLVDRYASHDMKETL